MRKFSKTSFFEAVKRWQAADVASALRAHPELVSVRDNAGKTALHVCSRRKPASPVEIAASLATARALVNAGADISAVQPIQDDGEVFPATPVWCAMAWGRNRKLASYLLKLGANPNHCMFAMVYADNLTGGRLLRRYGARIDEVFNGETPLIYAARHSRVTFLDWLLKEGADPNVPDKQGFTALHHAVRKRLPGPALRQLVKHGAKVDAVCMTGISVAQLATKAQRRSLGIPELAGAA
jgi:ankyrin repeat protein